MTPRTTSTSRTALAAVAAGLLAGPLAGCGEDPGSFMGMGDEKPFGGRVIKFQSTYTYFPSDFSMSIVRDTMPQEDVCRLLNMYSGSPGRPPLNGLPILPYKTEHYTLVITVDSVEPGDDVTIDPADSGGAGDMRYAGLGQYEIGSNMRPPFALRAGGVIRISALEQYKHVAGRFNLQFKTGEKIEEDFDVTACPKP